MPSERLQKCIENRVRMTGLTHFRIEYNYEYEYDLRFNGSQGGRWHTRSRSVAETIQPLQSTPLPEWLHDGAVIMLPVSYGAPYPPSTVIEADPLMCLVRGSGGTEYPVETAKLVAYWKTYEPQPEQPEGT